MNRRFLGGDETCTHVHAFSAQRHGRNQRAAVSHTAGSNKRDFQLVGSARQQDHIRDIVFTRVAATLEAVNRDRVAADGLGFERVTNRGALVDDLDAGVFQQRHVFLRAAACGFNDLDAALDDGIDVARVVRRIDGRQEGQVDGERLAGQFPAFGDFVGQIGRGLLGQTSNGTQTASVGNGSRQFGKTNPVHAALEDRVLNAKQFCNTCFHFILASCWDMTGRSRRPVI